MRTTPNHALDAKSLHFLSGQLALYGGPVAVVNLPE
jgi:hypothetical protein